MRYFDRASYREGALACQMTARTPKPDPLVDRRSWLLGTKLRVFFEP
jgi:hypothetical protein